MISLTEYNLNTVKKGTNDLLNQASRSEEVRTLAANIVATGPGDPIISISTWVRENMKYVYDPLDKELFQSPVRLVRQFNAGQPVVGDCDDIAIMTVALFRAVGIPSNVEILDQVGGGYDHAVANVQDEKTGRWIMVDNSELSIPIGWELKYVRRMTL